MSIIDSTRDIIGHIDSHPEREGLNKTPERYEKFLNGFFHPQTFDFTVFENEGYDEMIVQTNISFYSMCEHHLIPFFGKGTIAYIPDQKIVGLSKLSRTLTEFSRKLQNQERITVQVADFIDKELSPKGVGVTLTARHLCMEMRGIEKYGTQTTTTALRGAFKTDQSTRAEFLKFVASND